MTTRTRWMTAIGLILGLMATACGGGVALPPIEIVMPPPATTLPPDPAPIPKPRATLAFEVVDGHDGHALGGVFVRFASGLQLETNIDGYASMELELGAYAVTFDGAGYVTSVRTFDLQRNAQHPIRLVPVHAPEPPPAPRPPDPVPAPDPPPVVSTPAPVAELCADRDRAPLECVRKAATAFPQLLTVNTFESCVEFTQRVLALLGPDWGHVGKTAGEGQSVPKGFTGLEVNGYRITGVSHDAIKHRGTGQVVDLLGNATANEPCVAGVDTPVGEPCWKPGPATIQWTLIPAQYWRASNPFVPAVPVRP